MILLKDDFRKQALCVLSALLAPVGGFHYDACNVCFPLGIVPTCQEEGDKVQEYVARIVFFI